MTRLCQVPECTGKHEARNFCAKHYQRWKRHGSPNTTLFNRSPIGATPEERFWSKVEKTDTCWLWVGATGSTGYGQAVLANQGKIVPAHRFSYEMVKGAIPEGLMLDHLCHVRHCVNPEHLRVATPKQNIENFSGLSKNNSSGYRGVSLSSDGITWLSKVSHNKRVVWRQIHPPYELHVAAYYAKMKRIRHHSFNKLDH